MSFICDQTGVNSWTCYQPDGRADAANIVSTFSEVPTHSCQYWVTGMPKVCKYWNSDTHSCSYEFGGDTDIPAPTGYNSGECDGLGRKSWCSVYDANLEEGALDYEDDYICIAPCMERSGLGVQASGINYPFLHRVTYDQVSGYNEINGVGRCDGHGMGRGASRYGFTVEELKPLSPLCNYYRPYSMGFGTLQPQEYIRDGVGIIQVDEMIAEAMADRDKRLPYHFKMYNLRARAQKCAYWDQDTGTDFTINLNTGQVILTGEPFTGNVVSYCTCTDSASNPYKTRNTDTTQTRPFLKRVWSDDAGTVICNGAKPECPCYTGEWIYNIDEKTRPGMRLEAEQLLEMRFWIHDWRSQEEYERFFEEIPGTHSDDPTTADIYTFSYWKSISNDDPGESIMGGKKIELCVPADPMDYRFDKTKYMKVTNILFPNAYTNRGTSAPKQVSFPTLVRDLSMYQPYPLQIVYPYITKAPFGASYGCDAVVEDSPVPCVKRNCDLNGDSIMVIGFTVRNKSLTVVNLSMVESKLPEAEAYTSSFVIREDLKMAFYENVDRFLAAAEEEDYDGTAITTASADSYGFFSVSNVKLLYGQLNRLLVIVNLGGWYEFRRIEVLSQWHGGVVTQTSFVHAYEDGSKYLDGNDDYFVPSATVGGVAQGLISAPNCAGCATRATSVQPFYKKEIVSLYDQAYSHNYSIKKKTVFDRLVNTWARVGNAGVVLIEIDDQNLNYFFDWGVSNVTASLPADEVKGTPAETISLEVFLPTGSADRKQLPRNVVLAKPTAGRLKWISSDATINVSYWYEYLDNDVSLSEGEELIYPPQTDDSYFSRGSLSVSLEEADPASITFTVSSIRTDQPSVLVNFVDEEGALVSLVATKLLCEVATVKSRSVEAYYKWRAFGERYQLEPAYGFVYEVEKPTFVDFDEKVNIPQCGDHRLTPLSNRGPMWYPFINCLTYNYYDIWTAANYCTLPHEGIPRNDYRACGPDKNFAYVTDTGGISTCSNDWVYQYSTMNEMYFAGYANIVPWVNPDYYTAMGWDLPPFGNVSREMSERFFSSDHITYLSIVGEGTTIKRKWMPMVPDKDSFELTFNSLENGYENPVYLNQMNYFYAGHINEEIDNENRYRFEELLDNRIVRRVAYPPPSKEDEYGMYNVVYNFKDENTSWVWRELQKDIERGLDGGRFKFLWLSYPDYVFDMYKKEYRLMIDEGETYVTFFPPEIEADGSINTCPALQLGAGPKRFFELIYDEYDSTHITWRDDIVVSGTGYGESGEDVNPYNETSDENVWCHDENILFDENFVINASGIENFERTIKFDYDWALEEYDEKFFNRGLIANVTRNRLKYLPTTSEKLTPVSLVRTPPENEDPCGNVASSIIWVTGSSATFNYTLSEKVCPSRMTILGEWGGGICASSEGGGSIAYEVNRPGFSVYTNHGVIATGSLRRPPERLLKARTTELYQIIVDFELDPKAMSTERTDFIELTIVNGAGLYSKIHRVSFEHARYKKSEESIKVWERKYIRSTSDALGDVSLNGPSLPIQPRFGFESGGLYWPDWTYTSGQFSAKDKLRSDYATIEVNESVNLGWTDLSEENVTQKELYEDAINVDEIADSRSYSGVLPTNYKYFFNSMGVSYVPYMFNVISQKLGWSHHYIVGDYSSVNMWQPAGHLYVWNDSPLLIRCYMVGPKAWIYQVSFRHIHSGGFGEETASRFDAYSGSVRNPYLVGKTIVSRSLRGSGDSMS